MNLILTKVFSLERKANSKQNSAVDLVIHNNKTLSISYNLYTLNDMQSFTINPLLFNTVITSTNALMFCSFKEVINSELHAAF